MDSPVRIHDLARELNVSSREVISRSEPDPAIHHLANALSTVSAEEAQTIRDMFSNQEQPEHEQADAQDHSERGGFDDRQDGGGENTHLPLMIAENGEGGRRKRRRRGRRRGKNRQSQPGAVGFNEPGAELQENSNSPVVEQSGRDSASSGTDANHEQDKGPRRSRRRRRGRGGGQSMAPTDSKATGFQGEQPFIAAVTESSQPAAAPVKKKRRALYRAARVSVSPAARESSPVDE